MLARRLLAFFALPAVLLLEAFAWYGLRSAVYMYLYSEAGYDFVDISSWWLVTSLARAGGYFVGGLVAAVLGPNVALALGALLLAVALGATGWVPYAAVLPTMAVAGLGSGAAMTGLWTSAAAAFARPAHQLRNGLFLALYATVQVAASAGSVGAGLVQSSLGFRPWFLVCAAAALAGALVAAIVAASHWVLPPVPKEDPSERLTWPPVAVAVALIAVALLPWTAWWVAADRSTSLWFAAGASSRMDFYLWINPAIVFVAAITGLVAAAGIHLLRVDVPALLWVGAGFGVGAVAAAIGGISALGSWPWGQVVALVILAGGEAMVALLLSRIAGDSHWRISALLVGTWLTLGALVTPLASYLGDLAFSSTGDAPMLLAAAGLLGSFGFLVLLAAFPLQWWVIARIDPPPADAEKVAAGET